MAQSLSILVTGSAGFVGSHLAHALQGPGVRLWGLDEKRLFDTRPHLPVVSYSGLLDLNDAPGAFAGPKRWDVVFHLGACTDTTCLDEAFLARRNVEFSQALWHHCTSTSTPMIYASSAATYGAGEHGYSDNSTDALERLKPLNPYGWSKHRFDLWALHQARLGHAPPRWAGFKFFNVYGTAEDHKGAMASFVTQAFDQVHNAGHVRLFKSARPDIAHGDQARDFIHVSDVVDILKFAAEARAFNSGLYNLGTGRARTYNDLVRAVFSSLKKEASITYFDPPADLEARYQYFTQAPMQKLLSQGWDRPLLSLEDGIERIASCRRSA